jgi:3-methyladenine DNA glycosylase AlkD
MTMAARPDDRELYLSGVAADVELIAAVRAALRGAAQPELALPMQAYMESATPFLGVRVPVMRTLTRAEATLRPFTTSADLIDTVLRPWREAVGDLLLSWPAEVRPHEMSPVSRREALKHLSCGGT